MIEKDVQEAIRPVFGIPAALRCLESLNSMEIATTRHLASNNHFPDSILGFERGRFFNS